MMNTVQHVTQLLQTHGPATAYAYMEQNGVSTFSTDLVEPIQEGIQASLTRHRERRADPEYKARVSAAANAGRLRHTAEF